VAVLAPAFRPRRPTEAVLYAIVREHLETFLAYATETYESPLPHYVEQEFRGYLRCGVFAHGFIRAHCDTCGHDLLVAFSCKGRGVCPSCAGRRMANTAAHMVDRVLPATPVRQWVLSLPYELRMLAAFRADVLSALSRIFVEAVFSRYRTCARARGITGSQCGAVTFVQRFGSSLNLHVHFHVVVIDGSFARDAAGRAILYPAPPPRHDELEAIARRVRQRVAAWLSRRDPANATSSDALASCAAIAMQRGTMRALQRVDGDDAAQTPPVERPPPTEDSVDYDGFNLNASVRIEADDDLGRERLCRYGARPALSLERLRRLPGGKIAYRVKKLARGGAKTRVMTPLELLARLSAIVPPPRYPLVRFHGVLASASKWRRDIVPKPRGGPRCEKPTPAPSLEDRRQSPDRASAHERERKRTSSASASGSSPASSPHGAKVPAAANANVPDRGPTSHVAELLAPNILSVRHWDRLLGGLLYAATPRVDWATLLRRSFGVDVLQCTACGGRLRVLGEITEPELVHLLLERVGFPTDAPRVARARDPTELLGETDEC